MKTKLHIVLISIMLTQLLAACTALSTGTPAPSVIQTAIARTEAAKPMATITSTSTAFPTTTPTTAPSLTPSPTSPVTPTPGFADVRRATVRIEVEGSPTVPDYGTLTNVPWVGSGFIISPDGIAVTNNHVVAGAGLIKVWVDGEDQPRYARVLGTSECSDLAVIDIEGEGFDYLEWYTGLLDVGLDVYAAGYPLGEPEFTLTRGIVSSLKPDLKTSWAAVASIVEHDALLNPGNSGGPLVTPDGSIVGVNYAGSAYTGQSFAINARDALGLLEALRSGQDVHSIGINGEIVQDLWSWSFGLWVTSVEPGSPADVAGMQAGDLITNFGGLWLGEDETLATYCDVLRSHGPQDVIDFEVLRDGLTGKGQINGRALQLEGTLLDRFATLAPEVPSITPDPTSDEFQTIRDNSRSIEVSVPVNWSYIDGSTWFDDAGQEIGVGLSATPDLFGWYLWGAPGVFIGASTDLATSETVDSLLDNESWEDCQLEGRHDYEDAQFIGVYKQYIDCGGAGGASLVVLAAQPKESSADYLLLVELTQLPEEGDHIFEELMNSLVIQI